MTWSQVGVDGNSYWHYRQQFDNECGPSSVAMAVRILKSSLYDVAQTRPAIAKFDPVHRSTFASNWTTDASEMTSLTQCLSSARVNNALTRGKEGAWLSRAAYTRILWKETQPSKPTIVRLDWGHFALCLGPSKTHPTQLVILDPGSDARVELVTQTNFPSYNGGSGTGALDTDICVTTG